jgi:type IV pilus assembly protein PilM
MSLTGKNLRAFGLDISDSSVKVMLLKKSRSEIRPEAFNAVIFPRGIVVKDEIKDLEKLAEIVKQAISSAKPHSINVPYVITSLPESKSFIRIFDLPAMKKSEVAAAVKWEAEQHIPLAIDQVEIDWKIIKESSPVGSPPKSFWGGKNKQEEEALPWKIFMTAAPKETATPIVKILKMAGLQPVAMEIESISTARSCISPEWEQKNILFVDIGTNRTGLTIYSQGLIRFTSSLALAGVDISKNIVKYTGYSFTEAEKAKIQFGLDPGKQTPKIKQAVEEILKQIVAEIKNTIDYYSDHTTADQNRGKIDLVLMCGGSARLNGLDSFLIKNLSVPTQMANPWVNIYSPLAKNIPPISSADSLSFTTVIGLAQRGLDFSI